MQICVGKMRYLAFAFVGLMLICFSVVASCFSVVASPTPIFIWNASPSVPIGLYFVRPGSVARGDLAALRLPDQIAEFAHRRDYIPHGIPALKIVYAVAGDEVCRNDEVVVVNGKKVAKAHKSDRYGRPMPVWSGCHKLRGDELFLLNPHPDSFDSRYFGSIKSSRLIGYASRL